MMQAKQIILASVEEAIRAIDVVGSNNSRLMATRAIHLNVHVHRVPGPLAKLIKAAYNDIGAEAAISRQAYFQENGATTDMIAMGTLYQHREVRRVLSGYGELKPWLDAIAEVVEHAPECRG